MITVSGGTSIKVDQYICVFTDHLIDPEGLLLNIIPPIAFGSYIFIGKGYKSPFVPPRLHTPGNHHSIN